MRCMAEIHSVCVYCGSSAGDDPIYVAAARKLGQILAREQIRLVYGGGGIGLMGAVAHAAMDAGGEVTGVIPEFLVAREHAFEGARDVVVTRDMHERKRVMFERADAFIALPGGIGTLEELIEQLSWLQLGQHRKPVLALNLNGFWDPLLALLAHLESRGFIRPRSFELLVAERIDDVMPRLREAARKIPENELRGTAAQITAQEM
jgi:uncharacterized protein (TIGR00730 family)